MTELEFKALAVQGYTRIPLIAESFADLETPLSLYLKLANEPNSFLLESVVGGERFGRYSFIGLPARTAIRSFIRDSGPVTEVVEDGKVVEIIEGDPLAAVEKFAAQFKVAQRPGLPRFAGGLAGYFGYDTVRVIEKKLAKPKPDDLGVPGHPAARDRGSRRHRQPRRPHLPDRLRRSAQVRGLLARRGSGCAN